MVGIVQPNAFARDNAAMRIPFTKMQGAGNDFVVLDETRSRSGLTAAHYRFLGDRHFGVGADQILTVRPSPGEGIDFEYLIHNADGAEVEQCGNGARCFARFVRDAGLTTKDHLRVKTQKGIIEPRLTADGRVTVNMGEPVFALEQIPFDSTGLQFVPQGEWGTWSLVGGEALPSAQVKEEPAQRAGDTEQKAMPFRLRAHAEQAYEATVLIAPVSMGNPHAVTLVDDVDSTPVTTLGPQVQQSGHFPQGVNVGFLQVVDRGHVRLRVYERGVGETLACGSGACAAVVAGIRLGLLDATVDVQTRGGVLTIAWAGGATPVMMTGPATTVFHGEIEIPDHLRETL
jgi:diaminopimelate epimerase